MTSLRLLGSPCLETGAGPVTGRAAQRHRLALLALLSLHRDGISRDKVVAFLWPESSSERARNSLSESVYVLRRTLGEGAILSSGTELQLNRSLVRVDAVDFQAAIGRGELEPAAALYGGPFLDGFFVSRCPEFERWVDGERLRLVREYRRVLESLAADAEKTGQLADAVDWWRRAAEEDPYDARVAGRLMESLAAAGNRAAALEHARAYAALLRRDFGLDPEPDIEAIAARIREEPGVRSEGTVGDVERASAVAGSPVQPPATASATARLAASGDGAGRNRSRRRREQPWRRRLLAVAAALALFSALGYAFGLRPRRSLAPAGEAFALAVLPFHVLSSREEDALLSIGISDAIITRFAAMDRRIRVRPTQAVLPYEGREVNLREVGRALSVRYVLTGSIQRTDAVIRVSAQLIDVEDDGSVWGGEYRLAPDDLLALQDSVASQLAAALPIRIAGGPSQAARREATKDPAAYEVYLQGRAYLARYREPEIRAAIEAFERALFHDPTFAPARAGLAIASAEMHLRFASADDAPRWGERAVREAGRALAIDPDLAEAHEALAAVRRKTEFDWAGTIAASRRAVELNGSLAMPYFYMGGALYHLGLLEEAERAVLTGLRIQPTSDRVEPLRTLGTIALAAGRYAEAVTLLQDVQRLSDRPVSDPHLAHAYFYAGDVGRAERMLEDLLGSGSGSAASRARAALASFLASRGERERAEVLLREVERGVIDHHVAYGLGVTHGQLGRPEEAVRWLRLAAETGFPCYPWFARDPLLDPLRQVAEFRALLSEVRASWRAQQERHRALL